MNFSMIFGRTRTADFVMFSLSHLITLLIIAVLCLLLYKSRIVIRTTPGLRSGIRRLLVCTLILSEAGLQAWYLSNDSWNYANSLPLELCGITLLLSVIMLLMRSRLLYSFLFFAGIVGASVALVTPNLVYPFPHFRFILFFIAHAAIILASLYMTWIEEFLPTWKSLWFTMICLNMVQELYSWSTTCSVPTICSSPGSQALIPFWIISDPILIICS
jgi:hypothetical integral membrane protein (TIGR02206 family)